MPNVNLTKQDNRTSVNITKGATQASINNALNQTETYRDEAEGFRDTAETHKNTAQTQAQSATVSANSASASAVSASSSAVTATTKASEASTSASNAATSETNAGQSATSASMSATNSANSATASEASKVNSAGYAADSLASSLASASSATDSSTSASASATSATQSANSATASAGSATASATSATESATSATSAAGSATTATTKATEASTSATNAASSATSASTSASGAALSETNAAASASSANTSATNASTSETNAASSASSASTSASSASTSATNAAQSLDNFEGQYVSSTTEPTTPIEGMLWFDETANIMKVYDGNNFVNAGSSINGTAERANYVATSGQTNFSATYDAGYIDVYVNGIKLVDGIDFTATDGSTVVLTSGANAGDIVDIVAYGTFELADHYTKIATDALLDAKLSHADTIYTSGGNVGIGTSSAARGKLHIHHSTSHTNYLHVTANTTGTTSTDGISFGLSGGNGVIWLREDSDIQIGTNATERMRILSSGGITFNGDTSTANALDDYEEGTCTIRFTDGSDNYVSTTTGMYVKVGKQVTVSFHLYNINNTGLIGTDFLYIRGLPFSSASVEQSGSLKLDNINTNNGTTSYSLHLPSSSSHIFIAQSGDNIADYYLYCNQISNNISDMSATITYITN